MKFSRGGAVIIASAITVAVVVTLLFTTSQMNNITIPREEGKHKGEGLSESVSVEERITVDLKVKEVEEKGEEEEEGEKGIQPIKSDKGEEPTRPLGGRSSTSCLSVQEGNANIPEGLTVNLSLNKSYGAPNSMIRAVASLRSMDESIIFTLTHVRFAWFSLHDGPKQLSEWEEVRVLWDYLDEYVVGEVGVNTRVPDIPAGTDIVIVACLVERSPLSYKELGFVTYNFRVTAEEKSIPYYRVDSIDDLYTKVTEAILNKGVKFDEEKVKRLLDKVVKQAESSEDGEIHGEPTSITVKEGSYLFIDVAEGSLYGVGCLTSNVVVKEGDTLRCFFIGYGESNYNLRVDVVYSNGETLTIFDGLVDDSEFTKTFTHVVNGSGEGRVHIIAVVDDERAILEIRLDIIKALDVRGLCTPWVERDVKIVLEPTYGLPGSDVRASIGIRILPEDESMRWMFEYITVTWLDDANRPIPTSWILAEDDSMRSKWKEPLKIINWDDGDDDIYTGSTKILLKVPEVDIGSRLKLLVCFVHPMPGGYMDMVNSYTTFYVGSEPKEEEDKVKKEEDKQQQQQQQQQQQVGSIPCSIYPGGDRQINFSIDPKSGASGSSVRVSLTVRVNPEDYGEPFDPTKHWRWMYEDVKFFWLDANNNTIDSIGPLKVIQWSKSDPLYGEGVYNLTVPRAQSNTAKIVACFMHPMPGGFMEMTYRMENFTIIDATPAGGQQQQQQQQQGQQQQQQQEQGQQEQEKGRIEPIDFDIGEICGKYTGDREFISMSIKPNADSITTSIMVTLDSDDPNLEIWKFMYSYIKFRWYNYSTKAYISDWIPSSPQQLIKEWDSEGSKVIGRAEYTLVLPEASPGSRLGLIACFSHPWPGPTGYMDMNYTVTAYIKPTEYYRLESINDLDRVAKDLLSPLDGEKADSISATINRIEPRLDKDARYLLIDVKKGSIYLLACLLRDIPVNIGDSIQCIAVTDMAIDRISITSVAPDWTFIRKGYNMEEVEGNRVTIADITLDRAGDWTILAEFGDGETASIKASVAFNVIPEGILGVIAIIVTMLTTTVLYLRAVTRL